MSIFWKDYFMKKFHIFYLMFSGFLLLNGFSLVQAQIETPFSENTDAPNNQTVKRPNLWRELDLSPDQLSEIKQLNADKKPLMQAAQQRQRQANRQLDEAIYADNIDEIVIQKRLREVQNAHSEILKLRANSETAVRRILTPGQLIKFRGLREQFQENHPNFPNRQKSVNPNSAPLDNLQKRRQRRRMKILNNRP